MALLNKHDVAKFDDLKTKIIDVWDGQLKIRIMSAKEVLEYNEFIKTEPSDLDFNFFLMKKCCVDENNNPLFNDNDKEIIENKSVHSINFVVKEILELSKQDADGIENAAKNS